MKKLYINLIKPIKTYNNSETCKNAILNENKNKTGIYIWINNMNNKLYVGSALNLTKRLHSYYSISELNINSRPIKDALLKYGHNNFSLDIVEYCDKSIIIDREQYYLDLLVPEYNVLKQAYSLLGFKHSKTTIEKLKKRIISPEHRKILSGIHTGKLVSQITRDKLAAATAEFRKNNPLTKEILANIKSKTIQREAVPVLVINKNTNEEVEFKSQTEAGNFLNITRQAVYNAIKRKSIINNTFIVRKKNQ